MNRSDAMHSKLAKIKSRLQQERVEWAIFAGAAASCYGSRREITDIDILVRCEDLEKARAALKDVDTECFDIGCGTHIETSEGVCSFFLDDKMVARINLKDIFGVRVPVMSVEDNIVLKAILQRGEEEKKHDLQDIRYMAAHEKIDLAYLRKRVIISNADKRVMPLLRRLIPSLFVGFGPYGNGTCHMNQRE
jgi:hypothetical protein